MCEGIYINISSIATRFLDVFLQMQLKIQVNFILEQLRCRFAFKLLVRRSRFRKNGQQGNINDKIINSVSGSVAILCWVLSPN